MLPYSGDQRRSPPPPRAAFSSSLSPSAAPFTTATDPTAPSANPGLDLPTAPSVYAAAAGEWGAASWMEPPVSYMAPVATAPAAAAPPGYKGEASHSAPYGIYSGSHFSNFAGLHSLRPESSNSMSEKHPGACRESSEALSDGFGSSVFHQQQNAFVSKLLDNLGAEDTGPYPPRQDLNQYPFGAYDKYMTQLSSCSTDTQPHILSTRYVDSSEMAKRTVPMMNDTIGESSFPFSSYMNPCRINLDYFDCVWNEQKDLGYQTTDKQHGKWSNSVDDLAIVGNNLLNHLGENHLHAERLENGRLTQESSETKHDLRSFNSKFSSSEVGFVQPCEFSSELLEVNNTTVDSPCWKGTPATYQPSFGIMENNSACHTMVGTVGYNSSHQSQKAPELSSEYLGRFTECQELSVSENDPLKTFKLPVRCKNSKDHKEAPPNDVNVHNDIATHASYVPDKQHARTQKYYDFGEDPKNEITLGQQESSCHASKPKLLGELSGSRTASINEVISKKVLSPIAITPRVCVDNLKSGSPHGNSSSAAVKKGENTQKRGEDPSQCCPGVEGNVLNMSCDSSSSTRAIFLKLMHNLSVVLLSTCKGSSSLQEDEEELLQSVIENLTAASSKRSKVEQKIDDGLSNSNQMKFKNINSVMNNFWMATRERSAPEIADSEFKTTISQVLAKLPEDKMLDDTEVSQALIYKNLWMEAEASACKLKYELQLARMKLAATKSHSNTIKVPDLSEGSKGSNSSISSSKPQNYGKENITCAAALQCQGGDIEDRQSINRGIFNDVDADVFARLKVLQSRIDNVSSFGEIDCESQQESSKKSCAVEDAVMARLKVLKSRPDNITSLSPESIKPQLDASTNRADNVDDAVLARLRILESRPNNVTFLGQESSKQQLDASTYREDGVDNAVMARLRILKSRPDNIISMGDISKEHEEACNDGLNGDEVSVMASGGLSNTKIFAEQCSKFMPSDDLVDRLERKYSVGCLDKFADGSCIEEDKKTGLSADVATPEMCQAPSDEVNIKDSHQGEDNLGENHVWPQTAADSGGSQEINLTSSVHRYGSSPSEWEHVLKENFFHPGK